MTKVDGFDLKYPHRGSWLVQRAYNGVMIDLIPVAWTRDQVSVRPLRFKVGFKSKSEAQEWLSKGRFVTALSEKMGPRAGSRNIKRVFEVEALELTDPHPESSALAAILCEVVGKAPAR